MLKKKELNRGVSSLNIGLNWGAIKEKGWFDGDETRGVDLDLGAFIIQNNKIVDRLSYANKKSEDIVSANLTIDDNTGDLEGNDFKDNEIVIIKFDDNYDDEFSVIFFLLSYSEFPFGKIPYVQCRIYDGSPNMHDNNIYLDIDYSKLSHFKEANSLLIAQINVINSNKELIIHNKLLFDINLLEIEAEIKKKYLRKTYKPLR